MYGSEKVNIMIVADFSHNSQPTFMTFHKHSFLVMDRDGQFRN